VTEQPTLNLTRTCRTCGMEIAYDGQGRPPVYCQSCRPAHFPPTRGEVNQLREAVSRTIVVREHLRRVHGDSSPIPRHRNTDPETSRNAARSVAGQGVEREILEKFHAFGALTDDELAATLPDRYPPTVRTARSRLFRNGYLADSGAVRQSARGREMTVWTLRIN